ncbi:hypothetical protein BN136_3138 [Cronobacter universalis NCTC 9529]|nr:hypothetical protein BN136_3138 [Cronobacter universalis NCTC 9529]
MSVQRDPKVSAFITTLYERRVGKISCNAFPLSLSCMASLRDNPQ